jgi:chromosome segregation ATPase
MPDIDDHIKRIHDKLLQVVKNYAFLKKEHEKIKNELATLKSREKEKDEQLQLLALRIDVLKAAKGELKDDERKSFEKKINQYLKEVDKCIALLNE